MSLDLINVGIEPNDGTGDPPRVAGQKINANFQELYQALEATETATELDARDTANRARENHTGTQPTSTIADFATEAAAAAPVQSVAGRTGSVTLNRADVGLAEVDNTPDADKPISNATGAALTSLANSTQAALNEKLEADDIAGFETTTQLNARDTANRARSNHTGTQPASSITGLTYGFTYDQQAEPVGPVAGATWRERSAGGLVIGEWEWSGSLWLSGERYAPNYSGSSASATGTNVMSVYPRFPALLTGYSVSLGTLNSPQDASNYWRFRHGPIALADVLDTINQSTTGPTFLIKKLATPIVVAIPDPSDNRPEKVGSAGNLRTYQVITHYKLIRS